MGGIKELFKRSDKTLQYISEWINNNSSFEFMNQTEKTRSNTGITFMIKDDCFKNSGETEFRRLEKKITLKFLNKTGVISLGGGAFINEDIRKEVQKKGTSVWLRWSEKTLIDRISKNKKRPIAFNLNDNELKDLIVSRSKVYSKVDYKIDCEDMSKTQIIDKIIKITNT